MASPSPENHHQTIQEITSLYKSLPPRPTVDGVAAAASVIATIDADQLSKIDRISNQEPPHDAPPELFSILQEFKKQMVLLQCFDEKREAVRVIEFDSMFSRFDQLVYKASQIVSGSTRVELDDPVLEVDRELVKKVDDDELKRGFPPKPVLISGEEEIEKLSLIKVATLIETTAKMGTKILDLQGKLKEQMEWLPLSIGKLSEIVELNLSENRIMALPTTISSLTALTNLDIHSNQLINLPDSFGELINLSQLDLHANRLKSLPSSFGKLKNLIELDLSSNYFTNLPETIGNLTKLQRLNAETNSIEEIPYTIGLLRELLELKLDFNELKGLPEAIGSLESLEILTLHYNRIRKLPTTIGNLSCLRELDISFNELEVVPEGLCCAINLVKLNVARNFADLTALPVSIGELKNLEELDVSDNQIRILPDSFMLLSKLRVFRADETPLEVPPKEVTKLGAQVVVQHMADLVAKRDMKPQPSTKSKSFWTWICFFICLRRRARTTSA